MESVKRVELKRGKQRLLIKIAKSKNYLLWKQLAEKIGHSMPYLKHELFNEKYLLSEKTYHKLCELAEIDFSNYIVRLRDSNWGQIKGGKNSTHLPRKPLLLTKKSEKLAEIIGIILGDRNIWVNGSHNYVRVTGHAHDDREYLLNFVKPLFSEVFKIDMDYYEQKDSKLILTKGSKNLVHTLTFHGLSPGNKKKNNVRIPKWVFNSDEYLKRCIRGLVDTDGSVSPITGRDYSYIWFKSAIPGIQKSFEKAMKKLGIKTSKWSKNRKVGTSQIFIGGKKEIIKYYKLIGFNNPKHRQRFLAPMV